MTGVQTCALRSEGEPEQAEFGVSTRRLPRSVHETDWLTSWYCRPLRFGVGVGAPVLIGEVMAPSFAGGSAVSGIRLAGGLVQGRWGEVSGTSATGDGQEKHGASSQAGRSQARNSGA